MPLCADLVQGRVGNTYLNADVAGLPRAYVFLPNTTPADQCTGYLLYQAGDITSSPFVPLSHEQAGAIIGACAVVWVFGAVLREALSLIRHKEPNDE